MLIDSFTNKIFGRNSMSISVRKAKIKYTKSNDYIIIMLYEKESGVMIA